MKRYVTLDDDSEDYQNTAVNETSEEDPLGFKKYFHLKEQFYQIEKKSLIPGKEIPFSLYLHKNLGFDLALTASADSPVNMTSEFLQKEGDIVIKIQDVPLYNEYLESLEKISPIAKHEKEFKAIVIKEKSKIIIKDVLNDPRSGQKIKESSKSVESITVSIFEDRETLHNLISIKNYDYYTYTHSVNVAVLAIGIGIAIGLPPEEIHNLGFGAMLHDIGKSAISPEILNKPDRLTAIEYQIMQNHVIEGEKILREHDFFPADSFPAVTQHHEKLSGKGYPFNIKASKINLYGKITAIADCYDALTTQRPYKAALTPFNALSIMLKETEDYDQELLKVFIMMLGKTQ